MLFVFIHVYGCPTRFPFHMMVVSFKNNRTGVNNGAGIANSSSDIHELLCCSVTRDIFYIRNAIVVILLLLILYQDVW